MKKVLILLLVIGIFFIGAISATEEITENPLSHQVEYSNEPDNNPAPCGGGGGGSGDGGVPG